jgi:DMSO reductase family type II enzyme chaperone
MFTYSLQGLELTAEPTGVLEVEENETTARSAVYQVLGAFFASGDATSFEKAREGLWTEELAEAVLLLPFALAGGEVAIAAGISEAEYAAQFDRVFGGGRLLAGTGDAREAEVASVRRDYEYFGLAASDEAPRPPDHLATELDFLQYLCFKEAAGSSPRLAASFRRAQRDFLSGHVLGRAAEVVAAARAAGAAQPFAGMADLLGAFVVDDHGYVAGLLGG